MALFHHEVQLRSKTSTYSSIFISPAGLSSVLNGVPADLQILLIGPCPTLCHNQSLITALAYSETQNAPMIPGAAERICAETPTNDDFY